MGQTVSRGGYAVTRGAPGAAPGAGNGRERPPKFHWPPLACRAERASTLPNPHGFSYGLGLLKETGTIEAGKAADLVVLEADPLASIANTRKIERVFLRGREVDGP
jgi:hypothetical protein